MMGFYVFGGCLYHIFFFTSLLILFWNMAVAADMTWTFWTVMSFLFLLSFSHYEYSLFFLSLDEIWDEIARHSLYKKPVPIIHYIHKPSGKRITLYGSGNGAERQVRMEVDGNICTEDEFIRIQQVLWDHDIDFEIVEDDNGSRIVIDTKDDPIKSAMASQYIFMDCFHLPFTSKLRIKKIFLIPEK